MTTKKSLHTIVIKPGRSYIVQYQPKPNKPNDVVWLSEARYLGFDESRDSLIFEIDTEDQETHVRSTQRRYVQQLGLVELYLSVRHRSEMDRGELIERHRSQRAESHSVTVIPSDRGKTRDAVLRRLAERRAMRSS